MKRYTRLLLLLLSGTFLFSCSTGPEFERKNENDPGSGIYSPNPPSGENYELDEEGNVTIFWEDNTDFEMGFRIYKSIGNNDTFKLLADLDENTTSFSDTSKVFAFPTKYHIVSYSNENESDTLNINIDLGKISDFEVEFSAAYDSVRFSWQSEFSFIDVSGFVLSKKTDKDSKFNLEKVLPKTVGQYSIPTPQDGFVHEFKLAAYNIYKSDTTIFESNVVPTISTGPKELELKLITPDSLEAIWKDISEFEDSFQLTFIDQTGKETVNVEKNRTSLIIAREFLINDEIEVRLAARNNNLFSPFITKDQSTTLPPPILEQVQHISSSELAISILNQSDTRREVNIFRKTDDLEFQEIGTVKKGNSTFIDNTVQPTRTYTYYASTKLAEDSNPLDVHYAKSFEQVKHITESDEITLLTIAEERFAYRHDSNKIIFFSDSDPVKATVYNLETENIVLDFHIATWPTVFAFNRNETKIYTANYDSSTILEYDFNSGVITDSVQLPYSGIYDFKIINDNYLIAVVHTEYSDWKILSIDLTNQESNVIESFGIHRPQLILDEKNENLRLAYEKKSTFIYESYSIQSDGKLTFNNYKQYPFYVENYSSDLDTAIVVGLDDLSLYSMDTGERYWHFIHPSIRNHCCSNVQLLPEKIIVLQGQICTRLIDTKLEYNPVVDMHCDNSRAAQQGLLTAAGLINLSIEDENYILDLRRNHLSGHHNFIDVFTFKNNWKNTFQDF